VGRDRELELIRAALANSSGRPVIVTVRGASGSGKSRLLDRLGRDVPLVRARAFLPERSEPWTLLRTLLREVVAQDIAYVEALPAPLASALGHLPGRRR
jgi:ABC-type lipoprotein export system ATPase subunit